MGGRQISAKEMQTIIIAHLIGSSFMMGAVSKTKQDTWISFLLGGAMALPMIFVYCAIIRKYPGKDLFEIIIELFGKTIGKTVCILLICYTFHIGSMVLRSFAEFIHIENMPETPQFVIASSMSLLAVWLVTNGIENIGRVSKITVIVLVSFVILTVIISYKDMKFTNIKPMLATDFSTLLNASFAVYTLPFGELILFLTMFPQVEPKSNPKKIFIKSLIISTLVLTLAQLRNLFTLGVVSNEIYVFPSYLSVSIISIGEFFTRMEVLIGATVLFAGFIKGCVFLYTSSLGLARVFNLKDNKRMVAPCCLLYIFIAQIVFENSIEMLKGKAFYPIYAIPFQIILPIILLITAQIKTRKNKTVEIQPLLEEGGTLE